MNYKNILLITLLICFGLHSSIQAQDETPPAIEFEEPKKQEKKEKVTPGYLNIVVNTQVSALVNKNRYITQNQTHVTGWRIQIIQATDKTKVIGLRSRVATTFPELESYLDYSQPYFKLRIGNFTDYMNAYKFYKLVREKYNRASLVKESIPIHLATDRY